MIEEIWKVTPDNASIAAWIDENLTATTYEQGRRALIITIRDETDRMLFRIRWPDLR